MPYLVALVLLSGCHVTLMKIEYCPAGPTIADAIESSSDALVSDSEVVGVAEPAPPTARVVCGR